MELFLPVKNELSRHIQSCCEELYHKMQQLSVADIGLSSHGQFYFNSRHIKRLFFSIESSAQLLYHSIVLTNKKVEDVVVMDYGAGIGSLYILANMIGCKQVIYNDLFEEWKNNGKLIAEALSINIDAYILGDIDDTLLYLEKEKISCDIIISRNVIEHIHKLEDFYSLINKFQPNAIVYSSTSANFYNPAVNLKHVLMHLKTEKIFTRDRTKIISEYTTKLSEKEVSLLSQKTRGYNIEGIKLAVDNYISTKTLPKKAYTYTNAFEPTLNIWCENLLVFSVYKQKLIAGNYDAQFKPGFWDTHYPAAWKNLPVKILNSIINIVGDFGFVLAPFIYVIAIPRKLNNK